MDNTLSARFPSTQRMSAWFTETTGGTRTSSNTMLWVKPSIFSTFLPRRIVSPSCRVVKCPSDEILIILQHYSEETPSYGFSSLLMSDTYVLNQFGFVLVCASLLDTFVVRTLFVPALMFLAVDSNWWPGKMPPAVHSSLFCTDDVGHAVAEPRA